MPRRSPTYFWTELDWTEFEWLLSAALLRSDSFKFGSFRSFVICAKCLHLRKKSFRYWAVSYFLVTHWASSKESNNTSGNDNSLTPRCKDALYTHVSGVV